MACVQEKLVIYVGPIRQDSTEKMYANGHRLQKIAYSTTCLEGIQGATDKAALVLKPGTRGK